MKFRALCCFLSHRRDALALAIPCGAGGAVRYESIRLKSCTLETLSIKQLYPVPTNVFMSTEMHPIQPISLMQTFATHCLTAHLNFSFITLQSLAITLHFHTTATAAATSYDCNDVHITGLALEAGWE